MTFLFKNECVDYDFFNSGKENTILFLHGWGGNKFSFNSTINLCKKNFNILSLTIPTINPTISTFDIFDYVALVQNILLTHSLNNIIIICHSFGFRIALILKQKFNIKKIVVTGGAGIKKENKFRFLNKIDKNNTKIWLQNKKIKNLFEKTASKDYLQLSPTNKKTFKNIVNLNLIFLSNFPCPMLLFFGKHDSATKPWIAKFLAKKNNAKTLIVNSDHFAFLNLNSIFNHEVIKFLENNNFYGDKI